MSQKISDRSALDVSSLKDFDNVPENWKLYDTVLIGPDIQRLSFHQGWVDTYLALGSLTEIPFFNVRNRAHGLPYNNQDTRDSLPWVFKIFTIGVEFFAPNTNLFRDDQGAPVGEQMSEQHVFLTELPKHASLTIQTNQDERLKINCLMAPAGVGPVASGFGKQSRQIFSTNANWNAAKGGFTQGVPQLTNTWGFPNPLEVPRRANLSCKVTFSEYGRALLQALPGPYYQPFRSVTGVGWYFSPGVCGIRVILGGQRQVQQRGQYHA